MFVYRKDGTRFDKNNVQIYDSSGRKTVPVWAWISADGAGDIVCIEGTFNKEKYIDILENVLLPSIRNRFPNRPVRFIQDLSPIHTARVVRSWFQEHPEITVLPWPPKGADMNPIENVWGDMVRDLDGRSARNADELFERVDTIWQRYKNRDPGYFAALSRSMITRLRMVIEAEGFWTKY